MIQRTRAALRQKVVSLRLNLWSILADKQDGREQVLHMLSYFLRELAVLIVAFYPLDRHFDSELGFVKVGSVGILCLVLGIIIERRR